MPVLHGIQMVDHLESVVLLSEIVHAAKVNEIIKREIRLIMKEPADLYNFPLTDSYRDLPPELPDIKDLIGKAHLQFLCYL